MNREHTLPIDIRAFGFVRREQKHGTLVRNRCGRDFLYYVLHYCFPKEFNPITCGPREIERRNMFGASLPSFLVWTCLPFYKVPQLFRVRKLVLTINAYRVNSFLGFLQSKVRPRHLGADNAIKMVEAAVDAGVASGIDIAIGFGGLMNHVMFVLGYDSENLIIADTHKVASIRYEK